MLQVHLQWDPLLNQSFHISRMNLIMRLQKIFSLAKKVGSGKRALEQSMEQVLINIHWRKTNEETIRNWIKDKFGRVTNKLVIE